MPTIKLIGPIASSSGPATAMSRRTSTSSAMTAKFWLNPARLQSAGGFRSAEINRLYRIVQEQEDECLRKWNEYFPG